MTNLKRVDMNEQEYKNLLTYIIEEPMKNKNTIINSFLDIVMRMFWVNTLAKITLISTIEVIGHSFIRYTANDWGTNEIWHLIVWGAVLITCVVVRLIRKKNYA